jgi:MFS family permease
MFRGTLWRDADFLKLWIGQTVSVTGSAITSLALPTAAILALHAGPLQVGLLVAFQRVPFLVLTLFVGAWLDRVRRKPVMIASDVARALVLAAVPLAAFASVLSMPVLYAAALLLGIFTVFFDIGVLAFLPAMIGREQLTAGYQRLDSSFSIAGLVGPGLGGILIQAITAPIALLANSATYLASAACLALIRRPEPAPGPTASSGSPSRLIDDVGEGLRWVFHHAVLRSELIGITLGVFASVMSQPLVLVFAYRTLHFTPSLMGGILAIEGIVGLLGLWAAVRVVRRLTVGRMMWMTQVAVGGSILLIPAAQLGLAVIVMLVAHVVGGFASTIQDMSQVTLRQSLTPDRLQGRMNAVFRLFYWGSMPLASLLGGFLGDRIGIGPALLCAGTVSLLASLVIAFSALGRLPQRSLAEVA